MRPSASISAITPMGLNQSPWPKVAPRKESPKMMANSPPSPSQVMVPRSPVITPTWLEIPGPSTSPMRLTTSPSEMSLVHGVAGSAGRWGAPEDPEALLDPVEPDEPEENADWASAPGERAAQVSAPVTISVRARTNLDMEGSFHGEGGEVMRYKSSHITEQ